MRPVYFIHAFLFLPLGLLSQHIDFFKGTWQEANTRAAAENKYIFVDAYTEWCGWCKVMDKETFTDPSVIEFMNRNFIAMKIDFEDSLGIVLGKKFRVWFYPTSLIFNPQGQLVGKIAGYNEDNSVFIKNLQAKLDIKEERVFGFDSKNLDLPYPDLYASSFTKGNRKWPSDSAVTAYLETQTDLYSEVNWSVILRFSPKAYLDFVTENREKYSGLYGSDEVSELVQSYIYRLLAQAAKQIDTVLLAKALDLCNYVENPDEFKFFVMMNYLEQVKDWETYIKTLGDQIEKVGYKDPGSINSYCWRIYENVDDQEILRQAAGYMQKVIEAQPNYFNVDTYAALLYKTGQYEEALQYADQAIDLAKKDGNDASSTEELKKKIKEAMK
jgi:thioredoxin-related protein/mRNA-degrading endonuclease HigB of HigAB toxin-antitoxin module